MAAIARGFIPEIIGNINDYFQHVGQAAYVRGLIQEKGWLGRWHLDILQACP
jgi:hypothetical protein